VRLAKRSSNPEKQNVKMNHTTHINRKRELAIQLRLLANFLPHYESLDELEKINIEMMCITQEIKQIERLPRAVQYSLTYFTRITLTSKINEDRIETNRRRSELSREKVLSDSVDGF
jgi:hypothetical protein